MNYAENELHKIRILLSEKFADLEHLHTNFIKENIHKKVGKILQTAFATADVEVDADLNEFCKQASEIPKCQKLVNAIQNLLDLKVPFYVTVYPEIRHKVFTKLHKTIDSYGNTLSAEDFIQNLQNTMINWADRIRDELTNPRPFLRIICASLERFVDDSIRDEENSIEIFMKGIAKAIKEILEEL